MRRISFLLDEHVAHAVARCLRRCGVDARTLTESELLGSDDDVLLGWARREQRVIVTFDRDYLALARQGRGHAGIAFARRGASIGALVARLLQIHAVLTPEEMQNRVEFL